MIPNHSFPVVTKQSNFPQRKHMAFFPCFYVMLLIVVNSQSLPLHRKCTEKGESLVCKDMIVSQVYINDKQYDDVEILNIEGRFDSVIVFIR